MQERQIEMIYLCCVVESKIFAQGGYKSHRVGEFSKRRSVCPFIPFKMHIISGSFQTSRVLSSRDRQTLLLAERFFSQLKVSRLLSQLTTIAKVRISGQITMAIGNSNDMNLTQSSQYKDCQCVEEHRTSLGLVQFPAPW